MTVHSSEEAVESIVMSDRLDVCAPTVPVSRPGAEAQTPAGERSKESKTRAPSKFRSTGEAEIGSALA